MTVESGKREPTNVDIADLCVVTGVILLGVGIWMALGIAGIVGYAGGLLIVSGTAAAWRQSSKRRRPG